MQFKENQQDGLTKVAEKYTVRTTPHLDEIMHHPAIARQYLPDTRELDYQPDEDGDPIGDKAHTPVKGIVHRYPDRLLLKPYHACAVYCRFCFRRDMVGRQGEHLKEDELQTALDYIRQHTEVWEVILTGGDPFALSIRRLKEILSVLDDIDHVKMIRIHTRVPVAAPDLVTTDLCAALAELNTVVTVSVHCNHAAEITDAAAQALKKLHGAGAMLISQSVLLKNVNDNSAALENLFRKLAENRVKPYYLHHPDKARGTAHFRMTLEDGLALYKNLRGHLSGVCIPHYMLDIPGGYGKVALDSTKVSLKENHAEIMDHNGVVHIYKD